MSSSRLLGEPLRYIFCRTWERFGEDDAGGDGRRHGDECDRLRGGGRLKETRFFRTFLANGGGVGATSEVCAGDIGGNSDVVVEDEFAAAAAVGEVC